MVKISIICISKNSDKTIHKTLQSLYLQDYSNFEVIFIDGYSIDNTVKIIKENIRTNDFIISEKDDGIYDAINKGLLHCSGDVIGILHTDDFYLNGNILKKISEIFDSNIVNGVYANLYLVNSSDKIIRKWYSGSCKKFSLSFGWMPPHPTLFLRKEIFEEIGNYNTSFKISGDYDFILRLFKKYNNSIFYLNEYIIGMKIGGTSNRSFLSFVRSSCEDFNAIKNNKIGNILTVFAKKMRKIVQFL